MKDNGKALREELRRVTEGANLNRDQLAAIENYMEALCKLDGEKITCHPFLAVLSCDALLKATAVILDAVENKNFETVDKMIKDVEELIELIQSD